MSYIAKRDIVVYVCIKMVFTNLYNDFMEIKRIYFATYLITQQKILVPTTTTAIGNKTFTLIECIELEVRKRCGCDDDDD
jgi:Na+/melibiose symporter-like transporter